MARVSAADRAESIATLRGILRPGDTVTTVLRHRSASGMSRSIDLYALRCEGGELRRYWLSYHAARVLGGWDERRECVRVSGAGMDMGFHLVYSLSGALWPDGYRCAGKRCHDASHNNPRADGRPMPRDGRSMHRGYGGYALRQEWLG